MKKRSEKQQDLDKLKGELAKVSTVILTTFQGITVQDDTKLRRSVQAAGGNYKVVKNTIAERAANGTPAEKLLSNLKGTNSIAYTNTDPVALAKALTKIAKEELISKIMFLLNAPAQRIALALNALPRNVAVVVSEAVKAEKFGSGGAPAASPEAAQGNSK